MFDYLQQFNSLPANLRNQVSSPSAMAILMELENKYKVDLAMVVMKIMIRSLAVKDLSTYFVSELALNPEQAGNLTREIKERLLAPVADYLGLSIEMRALDLEKDINILIREAGLVLPSEALISRFKSILATYLKGVRSKIDARASLAKNIDSGGLNLSQLEIDRVFKVCDNQKFKSLDINFQPIIKPALPATQLDKIIDGADKTKPNLAEYNFKQALASGQVKKPVSLDTTHELPIPEKELNLPAPEKQLDLPAAPPETPKTLTPQPSTPSVSSKPVEKPAMMAPISSTKLVTVKPIVPPITLPIIPPITGAAMAAAVSATQIKKPETKSNFLNRLFKSKVDQKTKPLTPTTVKSIEPKISPVTPSPRVTPVVPLVPPVKPLPPKPAPAVRAIISSPHKPTVQDIKPMPKVMGPVEELQFLDLLNFRRLGKTPAEVTAKIFSKIKLLERDGYDKMVLGVKAWRQSPTQRLYLKTGQEALAKGKTLKDMVEARQKEDQNSLNLAEIEEIVSLNSKLVF